MKRKSVILVILWMLFIFIMSSFNGNDSGNQSNFIVDIICNIFSIENVDFVGFLIRKCAHFTEYLILGILVMHMVRAYNRKNIYGFVICLIYSISDEIHQIFVPGRSCQIFDVFIDILGVLCGILIFIKVIKKRK